MTKANIAGVHGISQQQSGRHQLLPIWEQAVRDGVERAVGRHGPAINLDLGYYGDLYVAATDNKGLDAVTLDELDSDAVQFLDGIEAQLVVGDPPQEEELERKGFKELPRPVGRLAAWLDRHFGIAGRLLFFGDLLQVRRYQRDEELAAAIRGRVAEAIGPRTQLVIGHSLGSVVAYEHLCLTPEDTVDTLITLGSPLGLKSIQDSLRTTQRNGRPATPPKVRRWVNVLDLNDPVTCGGKLAPTWAAVVDEVVENESDPHAASRYLGKLETGQAVVASLEP
jgi:hypothetical protein